jgi:hypothetical protein
VCFCFFAGVLHGAQQFAVGRLLADSPPILPEHRLFSSICCIGRKILESELTPVESTSVE